MTASANMESVLQCLSTSFSVSGSLVLFENDGVRFESQNAKPA